MQTACSGTVQRQLAEPASCGGLGSHKQLPPLGHANGYVKSAVTQSARLGSSVMKATEYSGKIKAVR